MVGLGDSVAFAVVSVPEIYESKVSPFPQIVVRANQLLGKYVKIHIALSISKVFQTYAGDEMDN